jgi:tRNA G10  N-methylase Trm11
MIPQIAHQLLRLYAPVQGRLFDPYCGTGTTLVEGLLHGLDVIGTDLNPLARLIARAKTTPPTLAEVDHFITLFNHALRGYSAPKNIPNVIPGITNLDYWFKPDTVAQLTFIRNFIQPIESAELNDFFSVAFSETVRESSNSRIDEFKIYRYAPDKLATFKPDVFGLMVRKLGRNRAGLAQFLQRLAQHPTVPSVNVEQFNTVKGIPTDLLPSDSVDIVLTSPPYGDSRTTVAYGQYSRFSAAWLGLEAPDTIDQKLMGGNDKNNSLIDPLPSAELNEAIKQVWSVHPERASEITWFYHDLHQSIKHVAAVVKPGGRVCYVVGNRRVKGVTLPTDSAIQDFFVPLGFITEKVFYRSIPNKRMPSRNSPSNISGQIDTTMHRESILILRRV